MHYRREIDGLRALAVMSVIFSHAGFTWISGGFIGVDVFFVISGYLITSIIVNDLDQNKFSLSGFYEKRARRILPALFFVLACCLPISYWLLLPDQLIGFSKSMGSVMVFVSNIYFRQEIDYFARAADVEPLVHTWSLAVEEQFYLIFPLAALFIWKKRPKLFFLLLLIVAIVSFGFAENQSLANPEKGFFDTRTRVWELLIGAILALYLLRGRQATPSRIWAELGSMTGFALIAWSFLFFDHETPFPGRYALFPVLGASLIICYATPLTWVGRVLASKMAVGIGLISYSAYLWHQPIFAFVRIASPQPPSQLTFSILSLIVLLFAYGSWRFVEQPFRNKKFIGVNKFLVVSIVGFGFFTAVAANGYYNKGLPSRFDKVGVDLIVPFEERRDYVRSFYESIRKDKFEDDGMKKLLVIGDSFSQDLLNALNEVDLVEGFQLRRWYVPARCQIYRGDENIVDLVRARDAQLCSRDFLSGIDELIKDADVILIAASWREWSVNRLPVTLERLGINENLNYYVFGRKHFGKINRNSFLRSSLNKRSAYLNPVPDFNSRVNSLLAQKIETDRFIDVQKILCKNDESGCPIFDSNGLLISYDGSHFTQAGARYLGEHLVSISIFDKFLK